MIPDMKRCIENLFRIDIDVFLNEPKTILRVIRILFKPFLIVEMMHFRRLGTCTIYIRDGNKSTGK